MIISPIRNRVFATSNKTIFASKKCAFIRRFCRPFYFFSVEAWPRLITSLLWIRHWTEMTSRQIYQLTESIYHTATTTNWGSDSLASHDSHAARMLGCESFERIHVLVHVWHAAPSNDYHLWFPGMLPLLTLHSVHTRSGPVFRTDCTQTRIGLMRCTNGSTANDTNE